MKFDVTTHTPETLRDYIKWVLEDSRDAGDCEATHGSTDYLVEEVLISLGYAEAVNLIRNSDRWYA